MTITFPDPRFQDPHTWKVAAFRVDPCAPGCSHDVVNQSGSIPQIRLIFQPVTVDGATVTVHDFTAHVVFAFAETAAPPFQPDRAAFQLIVNDLVALKSNLSKAGVDTTGPLSVHPGLRSAGTKDFVASLKSFLSTRLLDQRLFAAAFMGVAPRPEPWIFFAMARMSDGQFVLSPNRALAGNSAQMLTFSGGDSVMPAPTPVNVSLEKGVSTSLLFPSDARSRLDMPAVADPGSPLLRDVPDFIANPQRSNFLNTDCVSCHTESSRRQSLGISTQTSSVRYLTPTGVSGVDPSVLPADDWNVRNFGWFPTFGSARPTATQRTANESAEAADAINRLYLASNIPQPIATKEPNTPQPVASPLTLVMKIKSQQDLETVSGLIKQIQSLPLEKNPIIAALSRIGTVHFARFAIIDNSLAVITTYDGSFDRYIDAFVDALGDVFDSLLAHVADAPPLPVSQHRKEFLEFVHKNDLTSIPPFYSAYPDLKVQDILTLQKRQSEKK